MILFLLLILQHRNAPNCLTRHQKGASINKKSSIKNEEKKTFDAPAWRHGNDANVYVGSARL